MPLPSSAGLGEVMENVSFCYRPDEPILRNLSFRIAPGNTWRCGTDVIRQNHRYPFAVPVV